MDAPVKTPHELITEGLKANDAARAANPGLRAIANGEVPQQPTPAPTFTHGASDRRNVSHADALVMMNDGRATQLDVMGRAGYVQAKMSDLPTTFQDRMPLTHEVAKLAQAERELRAEFATMDAQLRGASPQELIAAGLEQNAARAGR